MKFDYSKTINEQLPTFDYYKNRYCSYELELMNDRKEIERLNKLISQREKKWEKWTTEKTILSTKMSDYLCKYQNIKREYTNQIKLSTDRKREIERLNNIIKEVREYIEEKEKDDDNWIDYELCIEPIIIKEILDKAD